MDYEKKYNELVERVKELHKEGNLTKAQMEIILPELAEKESRDEKMRKFIKQELEFLLATLEPSIIPELGKVREKQLKDALAYLEGQKEPTWTAEDESFVKHILPRILNPNEWTLDQITADKRQLTAFIKRQKRKYAKEQKPVEYLPKQKVFDIMNKLTNLSYSERIPIESEDYAKIHEITSDVSSLLNYPIKSAEWSEEDEAMLVAMKDIVSNSLYEPLCPRAGMLAWLKSLRPRPCEEIYQSAKHNLAIKFMNYLDENRPEGKMCLSNGECEDIDKAFKVNDWAKIMRYADKYLPHWKPSEEQMNRLVSIVAALRKEYCDDMADFLASLYNDLKKL